MADPVINQPYLKKDFGIRPPLSQRADHVVNGELYTFFTMDGESGLLNRWVGKDFVFQCRHEYEVVEAGKKSTIQRHVFVREDKNKPFLYKGKAKYEERFSDKENKVVL